MTTTDVVRAGLKPAPTGVYRHSVLDAESHGVPHQVRNDGVSVGLRVGARNDDIYREGEFDSPLRGIGFCFYD